MKHVRTLWMNNRVAQKLTRGCLATIAVATLSGAAMAQNKVDEITFDLVPNPAVVDCLRANSTETPRARATVTRGKLNDTLILDLDGFKPGLAFDLFTVQRSPFLADGTSDPAFKNIFKGSFGLAWYQSDIQIGKHSDDGHVRIKTILLDQIFGFDPDVALPPTNTFQVGFWFNRPEDAACNGGPLKVTPFNGEHHAGPFAMISATNVNTGLGPLCTDPNRSTNPVSCNP